MSANENKENSNMMDFVNRMRNYKDPLLEEFEKEFKEAEN